MIKTITNFINYLKRFFKKLKLKDIIKLFYIKNKKKIINIIFEERFGYKDIEETEINFQYYVEAFEIIVECLSKTDPNGNLETLLLFISGGSKHKDIFLRYCSMFWYTYLLIDIILINENEICKSYDYLFLTKELKKLLDVAYQEKINTDEIKYEKTLFDFIQYDIELIDTLRKRFDPKRQNRGLLPEHKKCMSQKSIRVFCKGEINDYTGFEVQANEELL